MVIAKKSRACLLISGRVQGVGFRWSTKRKADQLRLFGWIRNLPAGEVEIVVEGETNEIKDLIAWVKKGPFFAEVEKVEIVWQKYQDELQNFAIRH